MDYLIWVFLGLVVLFVVLKFIQMRAQGKQAENCPKQNQLNRAEQEEDIFKREIEIKPIQGKDLFDK